jgi:hypothetical protein
LWSIVCAAADNPQEPWSTQLRLMRNRQITWDYLKKNA